MDKYNKQGKFFLIVTTIVCVLTINASLDGFNDNIFTGNQWFILLGTLFIATVNLLQNIKEKKVYYAIGAFMITITSVVFYLVPQLLIHV